MKLDNIESKDSSLHQLLIKFEQEILKAIFKLGPVSEFSIELNRMNEFIGRLKKCFDIGFDASEKQIEELNNIEIFISSNELPKNVWNRVNDKDLNWIKVINTRLWSNTSLLFELESKIMPLNGDERKFVDLGEEFERKKGELSEELEVLMRNSLQEHKKMLESFTHELTQKSSEINQLRTEWQKQFSCSGRPCK